MLSLLGCLALQDFCRVLGFRFKEDAFLVLMLLLGPTVEASCASSLGFLASLHWPAGAEDMGHFGGSHLEVLVHFTPWAGHRLLSEKVTRHHVRAHRPITVSSVPVSEGIVIRQGGRSISSLVRALGKLPGDLGRFFALYCGQAFSRMALVHFN